MHSLSFSACLLAILLLSVGGLPVQAQDWESDGVDSEIDFNSSNGRGLDFTSNSDGSHWLWFHNDGAASPTQYGAQLLSGAGKAWRIANRSDNQELIHVGTDGTLYTPGNVGIGTADPKTALDVKGAVSASSGVRPFISRPNQSGLIDTYPTGLTLTGSESENGWDWIKDASTVLTLRSPSSNPQRSTQLLMSYDSEMYLRTPRSDGTWRDWVRVVTQQNGKVGIGTSNLSETLSVGGNVLAEEVIVKPQSEWADYVFDDSYVLPSLDEVRSFIEEEGHLPNVPSAESVKENGLHLGEMDATLLQKVEELTLYAIKQKKRSDHSEIRVQRHSGRLDSLERENRQLRERLRRETEVNSRHERQLQEQREQLCLQQRQLERLMKEKRKGKEISECSCSQLD